MQLTIRRKMTMPQHDLLTVISNQTNLAHILDNLRVGIIAHDLERRIFFFNHRAEEITGYRRRDLLGKDCHNIFGVPFCGEDCSFCDTDHTQFEEKTYTITFSRPDGQDRRLEMTLTRMSDDRGQVIGVLAAFEDVTDLFELQMRAGKLTRFGNLIGRDAKMLQIYKQIRDVAAYDYPVHLFGETGTGKELVAQAIHNESNRRKGPFVPINCGALPEGLLESELFGHVKGAFTGAVRDKKGRFELAHKGAVFLDEVAELSPQMQVKLLRFLQENQFERVGDERTIRVDIRIISATNKDLKTEIQHNRFRQDLYYRLNVIPITLPPLRQRRNDIPLLADHFLQEAAAQYETTPRKLAKPALDALLDYNWPGNVRELQNAIQFAIVRSNGKTISAADLPMELATTDNKCLPKGLKGKLNAARVRDALARTGGNKAQAAKLLGVGRATLYRFLAGNPGTLD